VFYLGYVFKEMYGGVRLGAGAGCQAGTLLQFPYSIREVVENDSGVSRSGLLVKENKSPQNTSQSSPKAKTTHQKME
jgi:hypothetical protein